MNECRERSEWRSGGDALIIIICNYFTNSSYIIIIIIQFLYSANPRMAG